MTFETVALSGMSILLGWGVANMAIGLWHCRSLRPRHRAFWRINFFWGTFNALLAGIFLRIIVLNPLSLQNIAHQRGLIELTSIIVFVSTGLAITGLTLYNRAVARWALQGYGAAIFTQSSFWLGFALILAVALTISH